MSMIRAAPTSSALPEPSVAALYSSNSSTYGWPPSVNGIAFCGIEAGDQVRRLTSRTCGSGLRAWISDVSRMTMSRPNGSAT